MAPPNGGLDSTREQTRDRRNRTLRTPLKFYWYWSFYWPGPRAVRHPGFGQGANWALKTRNSWEATRLCGRVLVDKNSFRQSCNRYWWWETHHLVAQLSRACGPEGGNPPPL